MNPDHHRSPRTIESRRPQIEIEAVLRLPLLDLHRGERLVRDQVLGRNRAKTQGITNSRPWRRFLGSKPSPGARRSGRKWHSLEDQQPVLFITFEFSIAGRYDRAHLLCPCMSLAVDSPFMILPSRGRSPPRVALSCALGTIAPDSADADCATLAARHR